jgi:hypothetical protein
MAMQFLVPAALAAAAMLVPADAEVSRSYQASGFHAVDNAGPFEVTVRRGAAFAVEATGSAADIDRLRADVADGTLRLWLEDDKERKVRRERKMTRITVTLPMLDGATLSGAGRVDIDRIEGDARIRLNGAGNITIADVASRSLDLKLEGAGNITANGGSSGRVTMLLAGAGNLDTRKMAADGAALRLTGTGTIRARASGEAEIRTSGIGNAHVVGTTNCRIEKSGMGNASCKVS